MKTSSSFVHIKTFSLAIFLFKGCLPTILWYFCPPKMQSVCWSICSSIIKQFKHEEGNGILAIPKPFAIWITSQVHNKNASELSTPYFIIYFIEVKRIDRKQKRVKIGYDETYRRKVILYRQELPKRTHHQSQVQ